uniref:Uncharacterized protein n=1 Tax=viral metagenome TaxID=1070528 RepID=A0A6C0BM51_9ZZZZ
MAECLCLPRLKIWISDIISQIMAEKQSVSTPNPMSTSGSTSGSTLHEPLLSQEEVVEATDFNPFEQQTDEDLESTLYYSFPSLSVIELCNIN